MPPSIAGSATCLLAVSGHGDDIAAATWLTRGDSRRRRCRGGGEQIRDVYPVPHLDDALTLDLQANDSVWNQRAVDLGAFEPSGGVAYLLYRKDRVTCVRGSELLAGHKLNDKTITYRVVATCCGAPMGTAYDGGPHWVDIVRPRVRGSLPPTEVRTFTRNRATGAPDGIPGSSGLNFRLMARLFAAWIPMLLSRSRASGPAFYPALKR